MDRVRLTLVVLIIRAIETIIMHMGVMGVEAVATVAVTVGVILEEVGVVVVTVEGIAEVGEAGIVVDARRYINIIYQCINTIRLWQSLQIMA